MLRTLFSNSNGQQRAGILDQFLRAAGTDVPQPGGLSSLASAAEHAQRQNPSIVEQVSAFYAQHPMLVKTLGAGALALIMSHLSRK